MRHALIAGALLAAAARIAAADSAADLYRLGSDNDPRLRETDLLQTERRFYTASSELLRVQGERPSQRLPADFYRRLADATLSFGMRARAEQINRELLAANADPLPEMRERIRLAEFLHQRGREQDSVQELRAVRPHLPEALDRDWQDTLSRSLLGEGRYSEAAEVLSDNKLGGEASQYERYNLGVALINDGRVGQGVNVLDRVGRHAATTPEEISLRDQANLLLGYHFLRQSQGGTAVPIFERISSQGAISNRALLGLGWAFLAPQGSTQRKVAVGDEDENDHELSALRSLSTIGVLLRPGFIDQDIYRRIGLASFKRARGSESEEEAFKRALVPWLELAGRDPIDPTVQEGLLAIPYCLERIGAHQQARQFYEKAIAALEAGRKRIDLTVWYVKSGRMLDTMILRTADSEAGWTWELNDLPNGDETFYLQKMIAENHFQEQVKNFRDVKLMQRSLGDWQKRIDELQAAYVKQPVKSPSTAVLFAEAAAKPAPTQSAQLPGIDKPPPAALRPAEALSVPGAAQTPAAAKGPVPKLQVSGAPAQAAFVGTYERLEQLKGRIAAMMPKLEDASNRQSKLIETMALNDLVNQKRVTEKYLIEARFALARIYDQEIKGAPTK